MKELEISNEYSINLVEGILVMNDKFIERNLITFLYDIANLYNSVSDDIDRFIRFFKKYFLDPSEDVSKQSLRRYRKALESIDKMCSDYLAEFAYGFIEAVLEHLNKKSISSLVDLVIYIRNNIDQKDLMFDNIIKVKKIFKGYTSNIKIDTNLDLENHTIDPKTMQQEQYFEGELVDGKRIWKPFAYEYAVENGKWNFGILIIEDYCDTITTVRLHGLTCDLTNLKPIKELTEDLAQETMPIRINIEAMDMKQRALKKIQSTKDELTRMVATLQGLKMDAQYDQKAHEGVDEFIKEYDSGCSRILGLLETNASEKNND